MGAKGAAAAAALFIGLAAIVGGCATTITKHGQQFTPEDIQQIQTGMSQEQVRMALGTPSTTAVVGTKNTFYYISSTVKGNMISSGSEVDRQVVAVYFGANGGVERVANYGLQDGKVIDTLSRKTPSANTAEDGILKTLFRNLGQKQIFGD